MMKHMLIALASLGAMALGGGAAADEQVVKFGCYAPLTGPLAQYGKSMENGFQMAIADFAATGKPAPTKPVIQCEDDQNRADDGINIARKFVEDPSIVAVIGGWASTVTLAAGPIYNDAKLVDITPIASHPDVTKVGPYVFRQSIIQSQEGPANAAYLLRLGVRKIAMIGLPNDYGQANVALTKAAFQAKGGTVVFEEFIRPDAQDFRQVLEKAAHEQPDMIYLGLFAPQASLVVKQARQLGINTPFYAAAALDSPDFLRLSGSAADGTRLVLVFDPAVNPEMAAFFRRYQEQYGSIPTPFAVNAYITARMLFDIVAADPAKVSRESIKHGLDAIRSIDSIAGPLTYDPATREWNFHFVPGIIDAGRFKVAD